MVQEGEGKGPSNGPQGVAMASLKLPALVAGRDLAIQFVESLADVDGQPVQVDARSLESGTASFAAQLVRSTLVDRHASGLRLFGAPPIFVGFVNEAADRLEVADRVEATSAASL